MKEFYNILFVILSATLQIRHLEVESVKNFST